MGFKYRIIWVGILIIFFQSFGGVKFVLLCKNLSPILGRFLSISFLLDIFVNFSLKLNMEDRFKMIR